MNIEDLIRRYNNKENYELLNVLNNPESYQPETIKAVERIVTARGGREKLEKEIEAQEGKIKEAEAIQRKITELLDHGIKKEDVRQEIPSELLTEEELNDLFETTVMDWNNEKADMKITFKSVLGGLIGGLIGGTIGGVLWGRMMIGSGKIFFIFGFGLILLSYFFVWLFSRKSKKNIATIIITAVSVGYALWLGQLISNNAYQYYQDIITN